MITDNQTDKVFLSEGIKHYEAFYQNLLHALHCEDIEVDFIPHTDSVKHIWARDYLPIQLKKGQFLKYLYKPDYLNGYEGYIPDLTAIISDLKIDCIKTDIIIDGGNVIKCENKVIMTDKIFKENPGYQKRELIDALEELMQSQIVIIPWDRYEMFGHADGMVRHINGNKVLINNYADFDTGLRKRLIEALSPHFDIEELGYSSKCNKMSWAYLNFLNVKKCIFVPGLNLVEDNLAVEQIQATYTGHKVIQIQGCDQLVRNGGALNCISWNI